MSKFKVGDQIMFDEDGGGCSEGKKAIITRVGGEDGGGEGYEFTIIEGEDKGHQCWESYEVFGYAKLIKGEQTMGRRTFRLLKETPDCKKGALFQEQCDDGTQPYQILNKADLKHDQKDSIYDRVVVEAEPKWFEEVFPLVPEYGNKAELEAFKKFSKGRK